MYTELTVLKKVLHQITFKSCFVPVHFMVQWCDDDVIYSKTFINIVDLWNEKSIECEHKMTKMLFTMKYFCYT